jgi:hypothetical protein
MTALIFFLLNLFVLLFKPKSRLEAENAAGADETDDRQFRLLPARRNRTRCAADFAGNGLP